MVTDHSSTGIILFWVPYCAFKKNFLIKSTFLLFSYKTETAKIHTIFVSLLVLVLIWAYLHPFDIYAMVVLFPHDFLVISWNWHTKIIWDIEYGKSKWNKKRKKMCLLLVWWCLLRENSYGIWKDEPLKRKYMY